MLERNLLKGVLGVMWGLENAMKKRSIRISAKNTYWPFWDIYKCDKQG